MGDVVDFDFRPQLTGYNTQEPSLRDIVYRYYREHFTAVEAEEFTNQYIDFHKAQS